MLYLSDSKILYYTKESINEANTHHNVILKFLISEEFFKIIINLLLERKKIY